MQVEFCIIGYQNQRSEEAKMFRTVGNWEYLKCSNGCYWAQWKLLVQSCGNRKYDFAYAYILWLFTTSTYFCLLAIRSKSVPKRICGKGQISWMSQSKHDCRLFPRFEDCKWYPTSMRRSLSVTERQLLVDARTIKQRSGWGREVIEGLAIERSRPRLQVLVGSGLACRQSFVQSLGTPLNNLVHPEYELQIASCIQ